jgi:hypothetical protein
MTEVRRRHRARETAVHAAVFPLKAEGARFAAGLRLLGGQENVPVEPWTRRSVTLKAPWSPPSAR